MNMPYHQTLVPAKKYCNGMILKVFQNNIMYVIPKYALNVKVKMLSNKNKNKIINSIFCLK